MLRGKNQPQLRSLVINWEGIYHLTPSLWNRIVLWWSPKIEKRKKTCKFLININSSCQLVNLKGNKNHYSLKVISQYDLSQVSDNYSWNDGGGKKCVWQTSYGCQTTVTINRVDAHRSELPAHIGAHHQSWFWVNPPHFRSTPSPPSIPSAPPPKKEEGREKFKLASFPVFMTDGLDKVTEVRDYLSLINSNIEHVHRLQDLS